MVITSKSGQLANRLFLFGHCIGFVLENGGTVYNPSFDEYAPHFQFAHRDLLCKFPPPLVPLPAGPKARVKYYETIEHWANLGIMYRRRVKRLMIQTHAFGDELCFMNEDPFRQIAREKKVLFLYGWPYRDYAAFNKHADTIRKFFQPAVHIQKNVDALLARCRAKGDLVIGIHIRRGDYKEYENGRFFYEPCQYAALMRATAALFPGRKLHFLICSNEAVDAEVFQELDFSLGNNQIAEDMYSLAKCDYILGPPSTYTMWASFMGQVPLYRVCDPHAAFSLSDFGYTGGDCDTPEQHEIKVKWPSH